MKLTLQADTKAPCALAKRMFPALENVADHLADRRVLEAAARIGDLGQAIPRMRTGRCNDDLIGIGVDHEIGVMRDDDDLALGLGLEEQADEFIIDGLGIEIFLGLIDDQRPLRGR
ncbi:MAG: hypothetical protein OJI97_03275 [Sphingopyxis sp.]|nr:hypothetical protein [Sphingopyxis sp.]MCW0197147.1 hypothetical protein [Sphingopyxis sp.]